MRACFALDLPMIYRGWFQPVVKKIHDRAEPHITLVLPDGPPIHVKKKNPYYLSLMAQMIRETGGVLIQLAVSDSGRRQYARAVEGGVIDLNWTNPLSRRIGELPLRYAFHYSPNFAEPPFIELAIQHFGEPKERRYEQFIIGDPDVYEAYRRWVGCTVS